MTTAFSIVVVFVLSGVASPDTARSPPSASDGRVTVFIRDSGPGAPEGLAADEQGNVFGGFIEMQTLKKYVRN